MADNTVSGDAPLLVVRHLEAARADYESRLTPLIRRQAVLVVVLGVIGALLAVVLPAFAVASQGDVNPVRLSGGLALLAVLPVALIVTGARRIRTRVTLPEVALTVTDEAVTFSARERTTMLTRSRPETRWDRRAVQAEIVPADYGTSERVKFTTHLDGRTRVEFQSLEYVDATGAQILAAVQAP